MEHSLMCALVGNASSLAFHWIYDKDYLTALSKRQSTLFQTRDATHYMSSRVSYDAYPNMVFGDVTVQGVILAALHAYLENHEVVDASAYETLIYKAVGPGSGYEGYIESYLKAAWANRFLIDLKHDYKIALEDDHLIGMVPFMAFVGKQLPLSEAKNLIGVFSNKPEYSALYDFWYFVYSEDASMSFVDRMKKHRGLLPDTLSHNMEAALRPMDVNTFLSNHAGPACSIAQSMPLMVYLLANHEDYLTLLEENIKIGGAIADRAMFMSFLKSPTISLQPTWVSAVTQHVIDKIKR